MKPLAFVISMLVLVSGPAMAQGGGGGAQQPAPVTLQWNDAIPPGNADHAAQALKESPRHGEWVDIKLADGTALKTWVVYPERKDKTGVVLVIHDIGGMRDWPRALGDQLAQDGFIAIVPDFLSGKGPDGGGSASLGTGVGQAISALTADEVNARLSAAMEYGRKLPSANGKVGVIGFCWGGTRSFGYAVAQPNLNAAVVYYGQLPGSTGETAPEADVEKIKAPVLGLYGGNDNRINSTLPPTTAAMKKFGKSYDTHIFDGAGHGFLGNQAGAAGANLKAAEQAWPITVAFLQKHLR
jgi:carboxymethylenebutenolidase